MENLKIDGQSITLVDQVEDKLLNYFRSQDLKVGDSIPNEIELSSALGVARSVLREALSPVSYTHLRAHGKLLAV